MQAYFLQPWQAFLRFHDQAGALPACVYLHGLGLASAPSYGQIISRPELAGRRAILVDLLGSGFSDRPAKFGYSLEDHARCVALLLDQLELAGCVVIGHSMGGSVAVALAAQRPDLVGRLVLVEALLDPGGGATSAAIAAQTEAQFSSSGYRQLLAQSRAAALQGDVFAAAVAGMHGIAAPHALYRSAVGLVRGTQPTLRQQLLALSMPRAYIFGAHSLPNPDAEALPAHGIPVLVVPDAGHGMFWEQPASCARLLGQLLAS